MSLKRFTQRLRRSPSPAAATQRPVFKVEVHSEGQVTHQLRYRNRLPFTVKQLLGLLQNEQCRLEGVLVCAEDTGLRLGPDEELDPSQQYILLRSDQRKAPHTEQVLALLLRRVFKPVSSGGSKGHKEYRAAAVRYYCDQEYDPKMVLTDMLTGASFSSEQIVATHICRKQWDFIMELTGMSKHDSRNILLLQTAAESKLATQQWTILPTHNQYQICVLDPRLLASGSREMYISGHAGKGAKWSDVHLKMLVFDDCLPTSRPARRVCAIHATAAIAHAVNEGWIKPCEVSVPEDAWGSEGYDKGLMEEFLAGQAQASHASSDASRVAEL